jgi:hypothetical protein
MQMATEQDPARRPVIEVLYVEACPNYRGALGWWNGSELSSTSTPSCAPP